MMLTLCSEDLNALTEYNIKVLKIGAVRVLVALGFRYVYNLPT